MIKIGLEDGVLANRYIYTYRFETDELVFDDMFACDLMRICVTTDNAAELSSVIPTLLEDIRNILQMQWVVLTGWSESDRYATPTRAKIREWKLRDMGTNFISYDGYRVGVSSPLEATNPMLLSELLTTKSYGICTSSQSQLNTKLDGLIDMIRSSARSFAAPEAKEVVDVLDKFVGAIAYTILDDSVRPGIVVLTDRTFDIDGIERFGDSVGSRIHRGVMAESVWER